MSFKLPKLEYNYEDLEPYLDEETLEIHYTKHHKGYLNKLNLLLEDTEFEGKKIEDILSALEEFPEDRREKLIHFGGGHANHSLFWQIMTPDVSKRELKGEIIDAIKKKFGDFDNFKEKFSEGAFRRFGSGWAWLVVDSKNELRIVTTENQDSPYSDGLTPILGIDVWEHAYYLKYKNERDKYIEAWFEVINWEKVNENYMGVIDGSLSINPRDLKA